jgi:hypothetical protein
MNRSALDTPDVELNLATDQDAPPGSLLVPLARLLLEAAKVECDRATERAHETKLRKKPGRASRTEK